MVDSEGFRPLFAREGPARQEYDALHSGVPPWLRETLQGFIEQNLTHARAGDGWIVPDEYTLRRIETVLHLGPLGRPDETALRTIHGMVPQRLG